MRDLPKAIGMYSGGLDSILAAAVIRREGFEVIALHFYNGFNGSVKREIAAGVDTPWSPAPEVADSAARLGITLVPVDVAADFTGIVLHPPHGYGTAANPCIDCRVFLLRRAKEIMEREGAAFVFTGEVAGQRPMSQQKPMLRHVEKASGLEGRLLRPLSARLLEPTIPERGGLIDRDHLYGFTGRSRTPQQELARELGIDYYPGSGGGCLLTEKSFGNRLADLVARAGNRDPGLRELYTLKTGRHLRLPGGTKIVTGRNEAENIYLAGILGGRSWQFHAVDVPGAEVFVPGSSGDGEFEQVASITARYSKAKDEEMVTVEATCGNQSRTFVVKPARQRDIDPLIVN